MKDERCLIVNADDFGLSPGINRGIAQAHEQGIVTSASLMVRAPAAAAASEYARRHPDLSVGLHIDLCEWTCANGAWRPVYQVVAMDDAKAVAEEVGLQLAAFRRLLARDPTHLDSHQHVHREEPARSILSRLADELGIVLRGQNPRVRYCGDFYGQSNKGDAFPEAISVTALCEVLRNLPPGVTELGCHPGQGNDLDSMYLKERGLERETLCHPEVRAVLRAQDIVLCSFSTVALTVKP